MSKKYIPNEVKYRIQIPHKTIFAYQGEGMYEETLEDEFTFPVLNALQSAYIEYNFDYNAFEVDGAFGMGLRVDSSCFKDDLLIKLLESTGLVQGLKIWRQEYDKWIPVYGEGE